MSSFEVRIETGRKASFSGTLLDATGAAISITAGSKIYCKIYRGIGATPDLDINSIALSGGSITSFTAGTGNYTVTIFAADSANLIPGAYCVDIDLVDDEFKVTDKVTKEEKTVKQKVIVVEGDKYRVPASVIAQLKIILEDNPGCKKFKVKKSGSTIDDTRYMVIPLV